MNTVNLGSIPMPTKLFAERLKENLGDRDNYGVYETGRKIVERMQKHYVKEKRDGEVQTETMAEIT